jgi:hypothetical protein
MCAFWLALKFSKMFSRVRFLYTNINSRLMLSRIKTICYLLMDYFTTLRKYIKVWAFFTLTATCYLRNLWLQKIKTYSFNVRENKHVRSLSLRGVFDKVLSVPGTYGKTTGDRWVGKNFKGSNRDLVQFLWRDGASHKTQQMLCVRFELGLSKHQFPLGRAARLEGLIYDTNLLIRNCFVWLYIFIKGRAEHDNLNLSDRAAPKFFHNRQTLVLELEYF